MEILRGIVRPLVTITGWLALVFMVVKLALQFADKDLVLMLVGAFLAALATFTAWWFKERSDNKPPPSTPQ